MRFRLTQGRSYKLFSVGYIVFGLLRLSFSSTSATKLLLKGLKILLGTTLIFAEALAKKLGWQIVDANPSIERYIGRQTRDILGEQGEAAFNLSQADIISHYINKEDVVVLLEECVVTSEQCRKLLSSEFVVYLKVSIPTQLERMKGGRVPSLPVKDMKDFLEKQHLERDAFYEEIATLVVESGSPSDQDEEINETVERDVTKVMKALEE